MVAAIWTIAHKIIALACTETSGDYASRFLFCDMGTTFTLPTRDPVSVSIWMKAGMQVSNLGMGEPA